MPYASDEDLPPSVRNHLPPHAREIFRSAFHHAWQTYGESVRVDKIPHRVPWAAVKSALGSRGAAWVPKEDIVEDRW
jgi:cation transport regulator